MTTHLVGEQFGDYRLIRLVGRGGFANVYLGEHCRRKTLAAVKVLNTRLANNNVKSFLNEARSIRLRHTNIVQILDFGLEDDFPFLVMEYAPYGSLRQRHPKGTQLKLGTVCIYVRQIADALQYAHNEGVVHRDIKPDNMLLGRQKELLLSDFGIASIAHTTHSISGEDQAGTINYMAPEQLQGRPRPASDQYALGIVVYEWICGTRPFQGSFVEIHGQHLSTPPPSLRKRVPTLSIAVEKVVMTALAKDPHRRFPTISAFASAFEHACRSPAPDLQVPRDIKPSNLGGRVFVDVPTTPFQEHTKKKKIEERPTIPKSVFQLPEIGLPFALHTKVADVLKRAMVSLPDARPKINALNNLCGKIDSKVLVSTLQKRVRVWSFAFIFMIVSLLLVGLLLAGLCIGIFYKSLQTSTVTITPNSFDFGNTFEIAAVASTPGPNKQEIALHLLTATSMTESKTVPSTGMSIPGTRATGVLTFLTSGSTQTFNNVVLRGASGVPVTFNGPITLDALPGFLTVTGFAVNVGSSGNIGALDITGSCCAAGITVKNGAFSGGRDPIPGVVVQQSDIDGAVNDLTTSLTPGTRTALQKQVHSSEQIVAHTLQCKKSTFTTNHVAGDHVSSVTVTVAITCQEEVFDKQAALALATNLLKAKVNKVLLLNYTLTGNIMAAITKATDIDTMGIVTIYVRTEGEWVYHFDDPVKQNFAKHIAKMAKQNALRYLMSQQGVKVVKIDYSTSNTLPDVVDITFQFIHIPGVDKFSDHSTVTSQPIVPTKTDIPSFKPTPTQGLGGS